MVGSSCFFTNKVKDLLENNHYLSFGGKKWRITIKTKARTRTAVSYTHLDVYKRQVYKCDQIHHSLEKEIGAHEFAHASVIVFLGDKEGVIALLEFFLFDLFICKRLDNADPG